MILLEKWPEIHEKIIKILNDKTTIPADLAELLNIVNRSISSYCHNYNNIPLDKHLEKLNLIDEVIDSLKNLLNHIQIKNNKFTLDSVQEVLSNAIHKKEGILRTIITTLISNAIISGAEGEAENLLDGLLDGLLDSEVGNKNKGMIAHLILERYLHPWGKNEVLLLINFFKERKIDFNYRNPNGDTILSLASQSNVSVEIIQALISVGANVNIANNENDTPLDKAIQQTKKSINLLIKVPIQLTPEDIILKIIKNNNLSLLKRFIRKLSHTLPNDIPNNPNMSLKMFHFCFYNGMSLKNFSLTDIVVLKTPAAVNHCLSKDKNLDITLPYYSISKRWKNKCEYIPDETVCSLAHLAAAFAESESLDMLIKAGLDIQVKDSHGLTPLHYAVFYHNEDAVKLLILAGADVNAIHNDNQNETSRSLAHLAAAYATRESLAMLIAAGLDIQATDDQQRTPLHYAAIYNNENAVKLLIFAGADVNAIDKEKKTPLHCVAQIAQDEMLNLKSHISCAKILLYAGANTDLKDENYRRPSDYLSSDYLYRDKKPLDKRKIEEWGKAFATSAVSNCPVRYNGSNTPTLFQLAVRSIASPNEYTRNFTYRNNLLPLEVSTEIEEEFIRKLTPRN